jgi:hypothetical protein
MAEPSYVLSWDTHDCWKEEGWDGAWVLRALTQAASEFTREKLSDDWSGHLEQPIYYFDAKNPDLQSVLASLRAVGIPREEITIDGRFLRELNQTRSAKAKAGQ